MGPGPGPRATPIRARAPMGARPWGRALGQSTFENLHGPFENLQGPFENIQGPFENIHGPLENIQGPFENIQGPFENLQGPFEGSNVVLGRNLNHNMVPFSILVV